MRILLAGVIEVVVRRAVPRDRHLVTVRNIMVRGKTKQILQKLPRAKLAAAALGVLEAVGDEEGGSFHTTMTRQWKWLDDPRMEANVRDNSGFSLVRAVQQGGSVYVSVPFAEIETQQRWLRLMLTMGITAKLRQGALHRHAHQTLFVVDEMPALGPLDLLRDGVAYLRGYGIKLVCVLQNIGQLKMLYRENWQTFIGNSGAVAAFSIMDDETAEFISRRLGGYEFIRESKSESTSENNPQWTGYRGLIFDMPKVRDYESRRGTNRQTSTSSQQVREPVLYPEEVRLVTSREQMRMIVSPADGHPVFLRRIPYFDRFTGDWYETRENIDRVEGHLGKLKLLP